MTDFYLTPTDYLRLRAGAGTQHIILRVNPPGTRLTPIDPDAARRQVGQQGEWVHVRTPDGTGGYSAAWYLRLVEEQSPTLPGDYPQTEYAGAARALDFHHEPVFVRLPCAVGDIDSFGGFGPNNYAYSLHQNGSSYYAYAGGLHSGLDFGLPLGSMLRSPDWGAVVHVSSFHGDNPYGAGMHSVIVRYGSHVALFGHMIGCEQGMDVFVQEGDIVGPSGEIGLSGGANGYPHLHFEVRKIAADYIEALAGALPTLDIARKANTRFDLRGWKPEPAYYVNPARFFTEPLERYTWPLACYVPQDADGNGYPFEYDLYSVDSIPANAPDWWT